MESVNTIYSRCSYDMSATRYIFDMICPLCGRNLCREAAYRGKGKKRNLELNKEAHAPQNALPLAGGLGGYRAAIRNSSAQLIPRAKYNKIEKNPPRRILSFTFREAEHITSRSDISYPQDISRRRHLVRAPRAE